MGGWWVDGVRLKSELWGVGVLRVSWRLGDSVVQGLRGHDAIGMLQVGLEMVKAIFAHIEIGAIIPIRVVVVLRHKHLRHGNFIGHGSQAGVCFMPHPI